MFTRDRSFYRSFFSLYFVLILHQIITLAVNLADNIMIGSYSEVALAGVAAVNQLQFVFQQLIMSAGDALIVICSQYWGQGKTEQIRKFLSAALYIASAIAILLFLFAAFFPEYILMIFTNKADVIEQGVAYLSTVKYTYLLFALTNIMLAGLRSVETVRIGFYVSVITLVINCSINYLLISGNFGAPELGAVGAAIGTVIARAVEFIIVFIYTFIYDKKLSMKLRYLFCVNGSYFKDYIRVNWRFLLVGGMFGVSTAIQTVILGHLSTAAMAANSAATSLFQMLKVVAVGASAASSVIIGKTIGAAQNKEDCMPKIKEYAKTLQLMYLIIGCVMSLSLFGLRLPILSLYSSLSPEAYEYAARFILVLCFTGFGTAYQMPVITGIVRGGGDSKFVLINDLISIWGIVIPLSFIGAFVFEWSPVIVIFCLNSDQIFKCAAAAIKVNRYGWVKKLTKENETPAPAMIE